MWGRHGRDRMVVGFTTIYAQSVPFTTKSVSLNHTHGEVYSTQHDVIKFVSDLRQIGWFSPGTSISSTNKTDRHDIIENIVKSGIKHYNPNPIAILK